MAADNAHVESFDIAIIGGGFYGTAIAAYLARRAGMGNPKILLVERQASLLARASYHNQARVHNGYHYPRSFTTAYRSRMNFPRFIRDWPSAVRKDFTKLYAIARRNSKVNARQFQRFCAEIGASLEPADHALRQLFEPRLIEDVFLTQEYAFDSSELAQLARQELASCGVEIRYQTIVRTLVSAGANRLELRLQSGDGASATVSARLVFNCTYSGLNQIGGDFPGTAARLRHELTEMALLRMPPALHNLGVTVMDGPFFSTMPFPARGLHTLSHVRYTPHCHWVDGAGNPYEKLDESARESRVDRMMRDVARYMPGISGATHVDSLFEIKTILVKNDADDGRPILFEKHPQLAGCYSILGGKLDNIYDVLERLDAEPLR